MPEYYGVRFYSVAVPFKAGGIMTLFMPNIYYQINPSYEEKLYGKSIMQLPHFLTLASIDLFPLWMP